MSSPLEDDERAKPGWGIKGEYDDDLFLDEYKMMEPTQPSVDLEDVKEEKQKENQDTSSRDEIASRYQRDYLSLTQPLNTCDYLDFDKGRGDCDSVCYSPTVNSCEDEDMNGQTKAAYPAFDGAVDTEPLINGDICDKPVPVNPPEIKSKPNFSEDLIQDSDLILENYCSSKGFLKYNTSDPENDMQDNDLNPMLPSQEVTNKSAEDSNKEDRNYQALSPENKESKANIEEEENLLEVLRVSSFSKKRHKSSEKFQKMETNRLLRKCQYSLDLFVYLSRDMIHESRKLSKRLEKNVDSVDLVGETTSYFNNISEKFSRMLREEQSKFKCDKKSNKRNDSSSDSDEEISTFQKRSRRIVSEEDDVAVGPSCKNRELDNSSDEINDLLNIDALEEVKLNAQTSSKLPKSVTKPITSPSNAEKSGDINDEEEIETDLSESRNQVENERKDQDSDCDTANFDSFMDKRNELCRNDLLNQSSSDSEVDKDYEILKKMRKITGETDVSDSESEEIEIKKELEDSDFDCDAKNDKPFSDEEMSTHSRTPYNKIKRSDERELAALYMSSDDSDVQFVSVTTSNKDKDKKMKDSKISDYFNGLVKKEVIDLEQMDTTAIRTEKSSKTQRFRRIKSKKDEDDSDDSLIGHNSTKTPVKNKKDEPSTSKQVVSSDSETSLTDLIKRQQKKPKKKGARRILKDAELDKETKAAAKDEQQRIRQLKQKSKFLNSQEFQEGRDLLLDFDSVKKEKIFVDAKIASKLMNHQQEAVRFMYDNCYGSAAKVNQTNGSGCILAHCMGLGKSLSVIALISSLIKYPQLGVSKIMIICPKSTVMNWNDEFKHWLGREANIELFWFKDNESIDKKMSILEEWNNCDNTNPGCFLIGYEAFRLLLVPSGKKTVKQDEIQQRYGERFKKYLCEGPDLVVCDEGHVIKNEKSATNRAITQIRSKRRIVLTGTPMQNHLMEYYAMVDFVKPRFLGMKSEFANRFANPIKDGQHKDSSKEEIKMMKQRSCILHDKLKNFINRKEVTVLKKYLPEKYEYCLYIPLTPIQETLYSAYLGPNFVPEDGKSLFPDYQTLRKVWTHVRVLKIAFEKLNIEKLKNLSKLKAVQKCEAEETQDLQDLCTQKISEKDKTDWWSKTLETNDCESLTTSNKLLVLFEIIQMCEQRNEKLVVFSSFVAVLNTLEYFLEKVSKQSNNKITWVKGKDYLLLQGSTSKAERHKMTKDFNDKNNKRMRLFLVSAKAGGVGINLVGANRAVILDTSWNPSSDQQNIFRIYRMGQTQTCYIYRLLSSGTMEEKIYSRSVTKQAMSHRVVDKQQVDRIFFTNELHELYRLTMPNMQERSVPVLPEDPLLKNLLMQNPDKIYRYHTHDSLLDNKEETELTEEEMKEAWAKFETEYKTDTRNRAALANPGILDDQNGENNLLTQEISNPIKIDDKIQQITNITRPALNSSNNVPNTSGSHSSIQSRSTLMAHNPLTGSPNHPAAIGSTVTKRAVEENRDSNAAKKQKVSHKANDKEDKENSGSGSGCPVF